MIPDTQKVALTILDILSKAKTSVTESMLYAHFGYDVLTLNLGYDVTLLKFIGLLADHGDICVNANGLTLSTKGRRTLARLQKIAAHSEQPLYEATHSL